MQIPIIVSQFSGGIAINSGSGPSGSCRFSRNLSIYDDEDTASLNAAPVKDSDTVVTDLVKWIVDATPYNTNRYAVGDTGNIYKIASNVWTLDRSGVTVANGAAGQGLGILNNTLFYTTSTTLGQLQYLDGSLTYNDDVITDGTNNVDVSQTRSSQTYTTPTSIAETSTAKIPLTAGTALALTKDPMKAVLVTLTAKGTGNVTVTVHDAANNSIGAVTVANASLSNGSNTFTFSTPLRINIGRNYHIHITSTVADTTVQTGTTSDLSTANFSTLFGILIADTDYHPIIQHTDGTKGIIVIGNEHYLSTYDLTTYSPNKIELEPGYKVRGFARENEFIVAYCWKGTNIDSFEEGKAFWWDGIQSYYNYSKPIPDGSPNAMISSKNRIFSIVGSNGTITLGTEPFKKIQTAPKLVKGKKIEVLPGAITNWQSRAHFGLSNTDDSTGIEQGVYEFGNQSDRAMSYQSVSTESLNFAYSPSTTIASPTAFKIGCVQAFGKDLYISYKDGSTYYVDRVNKTNNPCATGSWESLIISQSLMGKELVDMPQKTNNAIKIVITFAALPVGCTVTPKYRADRSGAFTLSTNVATAGARRVEHIFSGMSGLRYREMEVGFNVTATVNYPSITGVIFIFDPLEQEALEN